MYYQLSQIMKKPELYEFYTTESLWNDPYISQQMLKYHLDPETDLASRSAKFIEDSAAFIKKRFNLGEDSAVIDFGCGPGMYTTRLASMGCKVRGLDFSRNSIEYARAEAVRLGLDIEYLQQNYLEYDPDQIFDLATIIYYDYCVLNDAQRQTLLGNMKSSIKDDGYIFMDVCTESMYRQVQEGSSLESFEQPGFWSGQPHYVFTSVFKYDEQRVSLHKYTIVNDCRIFSIYNWHKYFTLEELRKELHKSGLNIAEVYSDVTGTPYDPSSEGMAVILQKQV